MGRGEDLTGEAGGRLALLAEVGRELSASLDPRDMLERLADLMVARLALLAAD